VFHQLALNKIDDLDYDWETELGKISDLTAAALTWLIIRVDEEFGANSLIKNTFANPARCRTLVQRVLSDLATGEAAPELSPGYHPTPPERRLRRQNAVHAIVDAGWIREGTALVFKSRVSRERAWVDPWLAEDPKRAQATWVNHRSRPLLWAYDGQRYSPTGLWRFREPPSGMSPVKAPSLTSPRPFRMTTNHPRTPTSAGRTGR
jgi:hypothetical protein